jgi:hypothetical protein
MERDKWMWIGIAIVAIFIIGIFTQKNYNIFSSYPIDCSFITNVDPYTSRYTSYGNTANWIAIDYNNDGIKEKWGYVTSVTSSSIYAGCGGDTTNSKLLVADINSYGDDIYYYYYSPASSNKERIVVCDPTGKNARYFYLNYNAAVNAETTCVPSSCTDTCSSKGFTCGTQTICGSSVNCGTCNSGYTCSLSGTCISTAQCTSGQKECLSSTTYRTCLSNGQWSGSQSCASGQTCSGGVCYTSGSGTCLLTDANSNNLLDRDELGVAIARWVSGG